MHSIVFWVIAFWNNCLEIQWFAKTHFTQSYHFWEGNVPAVNGIIQCLCRMNNVKGHSWEPAKLDTTQRGFLEIILTQRVYYYLIPPLCVRSGYGLSPEGCNFSRLLKSGFEWLNMFQLLYYDVVREDFTKKLPDHLFKACYQCPKSPGSVHAYIRASWFWKKILKVANIHIGFSVCYINEEK